MAMIRVDLDFEEAREIGLLMAHRYGNNLPKQYILLMAVAEVIQLVHLDCCGEDIQERSLVEKARAECDVAAIEFGRAIFEKMQGGDKNVFD